MKKRIFLAVAAVLLMCLTVIAGYQERTFLGARVMPEAQGEELWAQESTQRLPLNLLGEELPRDEASGVTFLPQNAQTEDWKGGLSAPGGRLYFIEDAQMTHKQEALEEGHAFRYVVVNAEGDLLDKGQLVATGLPMMVWKLDEPVDWQTVDAFVHEGEYTGTVTLFDPSGEYTIQTSRMRSHIRGNSSRWADKKSFKVKLLNEKGEKRKLSLCGMRKDDDWILDALSADDTRLREVSAFRLWEEIIRDNPSDRIGSRMCYMELVADGQYQGVYGLQEPVDKKQLNAEEGDVLYKSGGHRWPTEEEIDYMQAQSAAEAGELVDGQRTWQQDDVTYATDAVYLKIDKHTVKLSAKLYPNRIQDEVWQPFLTLVRTMHDPSSTLEQVDAVCDRSNLIDIELFRQALFSWDNLANNTYYYGQETEAGWRFIYVPWDLDQTFGNGWDACVNDGTMNSTAYTVLGRDKACDDGYEFETALPAEAAEQAGNQDKVHRWQQLRSGPLSTENVCGLLQHSSDELTQSGAQAREDARWPVRDSDTTLEEIQAYMTLRLEALDAYYAGL